MYLLGVFGLVRCTLCEVALRLLTLVHESTRPYIQDRSAVERTGRESRHEGIRRQTGQLADLAVDVFSKFAIGFGRLRVLVSRAQIGLLCYFKQSMLDRPTAAAFCFLQAQAQVLTLALNQLRVDRLELRHFQSINRIGVLVIHLVVHCLRRDAVVAQFDLRFGFIRQLC